MTSGDSKIVIRWFAPIDNGGSPITGYTLYKAGPGDSTFVPSILSPPPVVDLSSTGNQLLEYSYSGLNEGDVYRFYVVATNAVGSSAPSPTLSVVAGI